MTYIGSYVSLNGVTLFLLCYVSHLPLEPLSIFTLYPSLPAGKAPSCSRRILAISIFTCSDPRTSSSMGFISPSNKYNQPLLPKGFRLSSDGQNGSRCMWIPCSPLQKPMPGGFLHLTNTKAWQDAAVHLWSSPGTSHYIGLTMVELLFPVRFCWPRTLTHILTETGSSTPCCRPVPYTEIFKEIYFSPRWNRTNAAILGNRRVIHVYSMRDSRIRKDNVDHYTISEWPGELCLWF